MFLKFMTSSPVQCNRMMRIEMLFLSLLNAAVHISLCWSGFREAVRGHDAASSCFADLLRVTMGNYLRAVAAGPSVAIVTGDRIFPTFVMDRICEGRRDRREKNR